MATCVQELSGKNRNSFQFNVISDWWMRPDQERVSLWSSPEYETSVMALWAPDLGEESFARFKSFFNAIRAEGMQTVAEYERLFVGPVPPDCPPYEAWWRLDRPNNERGSLCGPSTVDVARIFDKLGLEVSDEKSELSDHISIQLEGMAYALATESVAEADQINKHLHGWVPLFCSVVKAKSHLAFYSLLAGITWDLVEKWQE